MILLLENSFPICRHDILKQMGGCCCAEKQTYDRDSLVSVAHPAVRKHRVVKKPKVKHKTLDDELFGGPIDDEPEEEKKTIETPVQQSEDDLFAQSIENSFKEDDDLFAQSIEKSFEEDDDMFAQAIEEAFDKEEPTDESMTDKSNESKKRKPSSENEGGVVVSTRNTKYFRKPAIIGKIHNLFDTNTDNGIYRVTANGGKYFIRGFTNVVSNGQQTLRRMELTRIDDRSIPRLKLVLQNMVSISGTPGYSIPFAAVVNMTTPYNVKYILYGEEMFIAPNLNQTIGNRQLSALENPEFKLYIANRVRKPRPKKAKPPNEHQQTNIGQDDFEDPLTFEIKQSTPELTAKERGLAFARKFMVGQPMSLSMAITLQKDVATRSPHQAKINAVSPPSLIPAKPVVPLVEPIDGRYRCQECGYTTSNRSHLLQHIRKVHGDTSQYRALLEYSKERTCAKCGSHFRKLSSLQRHLEYMHPAVASMSACPFCGLDIASAADLEVHLAAAHPSECVECGHRFASPERMKKHQEETHKGGFAKCPYCHKHVGTIVMHTHIQVTHSDQLSSYCVRCHRFLRTIEDIVSHYALHQKEDEYMCVPCRLVFPSKTDLVKHTSNDHFVVPNTLVFQCMFCTTWSISSDVLLTHVRLLHNALLNTGTQPQLIPILVQHLRPRAFVAHAPFAKDWDASLRKKS